MTTDINESQLQKTAPQIAKELGKGWKVEDQKREYAHYVELHGPNGAKLGISTAHEKGRFSISGRYDDRDNRGQQVSSAIPYGESNPSITVAADKAPRLIAGDISRKLLPKYLEYLKATQERVRQYNEHNDASKATAERLAKLVGGKVHGLESGSHGSPQVNLYSSKALPEMTGDIRCSGTGVSFERFSVSADEAAAMLTALVEARGFGKKGAK